ncbi:leukocidin family pore-forming toxin [Aeromonas veronii]
MKKKISFNKCYLAYLLLASPYLLAEEYGQISADAEQLLNGYQGNIDYVNINDVLSSKTTFDESDFRRILASGGKVLFDLDSTNSSNTVSELYEKLRSLTGVSVGQSPMMIFNRYRDGIMVTPIATAKLAEENKNADKVNNIFNKDIIEDIDKKIDAIQNERNIQVKEGEDGSLPTYSLYINRQIPITAEQCSFWNTYNHDWPDRFAWTPYKRSFCASPNISLVYRVNMMRSLALGASGSATPDAKLLRVTLDESSSGAGITLNHITGNGGLRWTRDTNPNGIPLDGPTAAFGTNAIASYYEISVAPNNTSATLLSSAPINQNTNYDNTEEKGLEIGGTATGDLSCQGETSLTEKPGEISNGSKTVCGPKMSLQASVKYTQKRTLKYQTQDYRTRVGQDAAHRMVFTYQREQYANTEDLLWKHETSFGDPFEYALDQMRIKPLSYMGFKPNVDLIYSAAPSERGQTTFNIRAAVGIKPLYTFNWRHYYVLWGTTTYEAHHNNEGRTVQDEYPLTVDWNHPVFIGGAPVNLQLASFTNKCISVMSNFTLQSETCDQWNRKQSFIRDGQKRYRSAVNSDYCLDGSNLSAMQPCSDYNRNQQWEWADTEPHLINVATLDSLAHNKSNGSLSLTPTGPGVTIPSALSADTATNYTSIFNYLPECHSWSDNRTGVIGDVYEYENSYASRLEYFRLKKSTYWYFPTNATSNDDWEYLGTQRQCKWP